MCEEKKSEKTSKTVNKIEDLFTLNGLDFGRERRMQVKRKKIKGPNSSDIKEQQEQRITKIFHEILSCVKCKTGRRIKDE